MECYLRTDGKQRNYKDNYSWSFSSRYGYGDRHRNGRHKLDDDVFAAYCHGGKLRHRNKLGQQITASGRAQLRPLFPLSIGDLT